MGLATFTDLTTSVGKWLHRADLAASIPDFITLAETRIYQGSQDSQMPTDPLRLTTMETQVSGSTATGIGALNDLIELRKIVVGAEPHTHVLRVAPREEITRLQRYPGVPRAYSIEAGTVIIGPIPDADYPYTITYFKRFPALSANQTTNWLLTNAPNVYLYGTLIETAPFLNNDARLLTWYRLFAAGLQALQAQDDRLRYSGGALVMRPA